jgi:hypothetical protein
VESFPFTLDWVKLSQRLLLHGKISVEIHVGRFDTFMTEPQGNRGDIHASLEQMHGGGVPVMPRAALPA